VLFIHTSDYLRYLRRKQTQLPTTPENVTTLPCKMLNLFIPLKVMLRSSKHLWLWKEPVVMCENRNVRQTTSQQVFKLTTFCTDTCFQSFSPLINCSVEIQPMSQQDVSATHPYCGLVLDTRALAACLRRGNLPGWGQNCWLATCQDRTDELRCLTAPRLCHEHDVLAHCLTGRQTCLQQCCGSLVAASASATRLSNTRGLPLIFAPCWMNMSLVQPSLDTVQQRVYRVPIRDTDEFWKHLVATWAEFRTTWWNATLPSVKWRSFAFYKVVR